MVSIRPNRCVTLTNLINHKIFNTMKHFFTFLFAAVFAVMTVNADELALAPESAKSYVQTGSSNLSVSEGALDVAWTVDAAWSVAGAAFDLADLTDVKQISFDYMGDGIGVDMLVWLEDAEGNKFWDGDKGGLSLAEADWQSVTLTPNKELWSDPSEGPWVKLVFVANPSAATSGEFYLRNVKLTVPSTAPETAPVAPTHEAANVLPLYCSSYAGNSMNYFVFGWGGVTTWKELEIDNTKIMSCKDMKWEILGTSTSEPAVTDFSGYEKFHFDVWVPEVSRINVTFETASGTKPTCMFRLNAGWNTIDADPAWWKVGEDDANFSDVKFLIFEHYEKPNPENAEEWISFEGNPFAFTNLYWWKAPAIDYPDAPADPTISEGGVMALFSPAYTTNNVGFEPQNWGGAELKSVDGKFFYTPAMTWDAFTNWGTDRYNMTAYDMFSCDIWVEVDANIKITFEALGAGDGGSGWKNGAVVEGLKANQWNHVTVDLLNAPFDSYDFTDMRYLILEGFTNEGSPLGIANAFFWDSLTPVQNVSVEGKAVKRIVNGQIMIEKNGVLYNVLGTQF